MALKAIEWEGVEWINLTEDGDQWQVLVNIVLNCLCSIKYWEFLDTSAAINLSEVSEWVSEWVSESGSGGSLLAFHDRGLSSTHRTLVDVVTMGQFFSPFILVFTCQLSFHQCSVHAYHQGLVQQAIWPRDSLILLLKSDWKKYVI
jgi:hypothetical protein